MKEIGRKKEKGEGGKKGKIWSRFDSVDSIVCARNQEQVLMLILDSRSERMNTGVWIPHEFPMEVC